MNITMSTPTNTAENLALQRVGWGEERTPTWVYVGVCCAHPNPDYPDFVSFPRVGVAGSRNVRPAGGMTEVAFLNRQLFILPLPSSRHGCRDQMPGRVKNLAVALAAPSEPA
uniref:Uncharacterized protein n=1 Tax=Candidatus Kentrum sp. LPFa TaxID=2126335 RepID=A0A450WM82_9GAMM|nr:MAG: hypothetical protein BECKLPF1236B_GA0070989_11341 [Candidatus Kentron sp. LPFa]